MNVKEADRTQGHDSKHDAEGNLERSRHWLGLRLSEFTLWRDAPVHVGLSLWASSTRHPGGRSIAGCHLAVLDVHLRMPITSEINGINVGSGFHLFGWLTVSTRFSDTELGPMSGHWPTTSRRCGRDPDSSRQVTG